MINLTCVTHCRLDFKIRLLGKGNLGSFHSYQFDARATNKCPEPGEGLQVGRRASAGRHKLPSPASKLSSLGAHLKCLCANTHSMGNKQEEVERCACLQGYDLLASMMTGALERKDRDSLASTGSGGEERVMPSVLMSSAWSAWSWSCAWG